MKKLFLFVVSSIILLIGGCASVDPVQTPLIYSMEYKEPKRVRFSGRGAGAGMMMAGSMGSMGIAIGFAIDEGIAKDIAETASAGGVDFDGLFREQIQNSSNESIDWADKAKWQEPGDNSGVDRIFRVEKYGFVSVRGSADEVYPNIVVSLIESNGNSQTIRIPDDFLDAREQRLPRSSFDQIKTNPTEIERLWRQSIALIQP